jgi:hypothetical protein
MRSKHVIALDPDFCALEQSTANDPYRQLVLAIINRAHEDATGHVMYPQGYNPWHLEQEARVWLTEGREVTILLELAGYDADALMRPLRAALAVRP